MTSRCVLRRSLSLVATSLLLVAGAQAQPAARTLALNETLELAIERAVVYVSVEYTKTNSTRTYLESGSGFFVAPGLVITNHHVVESTLSESNAELKVRLFSGTPESVFLPAQVIKADARADLALLRVKGNLPEIAPLQLDAELPGKQTAVFAFGFPLGTMLDRSKNGPNISLRRGYVSRLINDGTNIEADLNIDKGISGGPMVDESGVVRGVVRAMAGSDYNKSYAGLAVSSPVLINFCQSAGSEVTLRGGQVVAPSARVNTPVELGREPAPRPRTGLDDDTFRAFFAVGAALRLSTLVPQLLAREKDDYSPDLRQSSRNNADLVLSNLRKISAPAELLQRARELGTLISDVKTEPKLVGEKSGVLEQACDEWVTSVPADEKLNYDLGAWLTELSLGLLDVKEGKDVRSCEYFIKSAQAQQATPEILGLMDRLLTSLKALQVKDTDETRRAISKDADRLIGVGYLAMQDSGLSPQPKPQRPSTPGGGNNRIQVQF